MTQAAGHLGLMLLTLATLASAGRAAEVALTLRDGRVARGTLAEQSGDGRLWLKTSTRGIVLQSGFAWEDVREAELDGRPVALAQLHESARAQTRVQELPRPQSALPAASAPLPPPSPATFESEGGPVVSLEGQATLANWDADPEFDGLRLFLRPLDRAGRVRPVSGQVDAKLLGNTRTAVSMKNGSPLTQALELGDWTIPIRGRDYANGEISVDLPFTRFDPEVDVRTDFTGWLRVRLGIPGQGVVEADVVDVCLRPYTRTRDMLQLYRGSRLYPGDFRLPQIPAYAPVIPPPSRW